MHVGNAFSALLCQQWVRQHRARLLLRIEDIDFTRCRKEYTDAILEDLRWLGVDWHGDVRRQSEHLPAYQSVMKRLHDMGMIYPCFCTRRRIREEINRMSVAPHAEDTVGLYPGTCRKIAAEQQHERMSRQHYAWRLDMTGALKHVDQHLSWKDGEGRHHAVKSVMYGDAVIGRKDIGTSYHLATVVDDAAQGVTHVIRGEDLRPFAGLHRLLQALLDLPDPVYIHHPLLNDHAGNRLAKRHGATTIRSLREAGMQPEPLRDSLLHSPDFVWHGIRPS